jgi:hypothetical protein
MSGAYVAYSIWLLPAEDDYDRLARIVDELAPLFRTPPFPPHVTVQGDLPKRLADVSGAARQIASTLPAQRWPVRGIEMSDHHFRTLYAAFDGTELFPPLLERAATLTGTRDGLSPFPHLSLAYGPLDPLRKQALAAEVAEGLPRHLAFDRLAVAISGKTVPIPSWRALETFALLPA